MARVKLMTREEMDEEQKAQYDLFPSNLIKGLLLTKTLTKGYAALGTALRFTKLSPDIREFVIVRVAYLSRCEYELMQHRGLAKQQGWKEEDIKAIAENDGEYFDERMRAVLTFVNECVTQVKASENTWKTLKNYLDEEETAELIILIGHYMMTARFLENLEIDLDDEPTSWDNITRQ